MHDRSTGSAEADGDLGEEGVLVRGDVVVDAGDVAGGREQRVAQDPAADLLVDAIEELVDPLGLDRPRGPSRSPAGGSPRS